MASFGSRPDLTVEERFGLTPIVAHDRPMLAAAGRAPFTADAFVTPSDSLQNRKPALDGGAP